MTLSPEEEQAHDIGLIARMTKRDAEAFAAFYDLHASAVYSLLFQEIARLCDLSVEAVKGLLTRIDEASAWERGQFPFIRLIHFQAGPRLSTAEAGFVRTAAGATFPRHRHLGSEITLVLEGGLWDNGRHYLPREIIEKDTDSVHEYRADPERDLITVVVYHGIEIL